MDANVPKMGPARRVLALVTLPIFIIGCVLFGSLVLLGVALDIYAGEVLRLSKGSTFYYRWDTQPRAFIFAIGVWLTVGLVSLGCVRPLYRRLKAIWLQHRNADEA